MLMTILYIRWGWCTMPLENDNYRSGIENHQWLAGRRKELRGFTPRREWSGEFAAWRL